MSPDPANGGTLDDPQSLNLYSYVGNDPVNFNDPEGLTKCGDYIVGAGGTALRNMMDPTTESGLFASVVWAEVGLDGRGSILTANYFKEREAIAMSILNRVAILNGRLRITGYTAASLDWGPVGASVRNVLGWVGAHGAQYATVQGGPQNPSRPCDE